MDVGFLCLFGLSCVLVGVGEGICGGISVSNAGLVKYDAIAPGTRERAPTTQRRAQSAKGNAASRMSAYNIPMVLRFSMDINSGFRGDLGRSGSGGGVERAATDECLAE
jgi:hypothetical protein